MMSLHIWALSHGIASLFARGDAGRRRNLPMAPEELLEAGVLIYLAASASSPRPQHPLRIFPRHLDSRAGRVHLCEC